MNRKIFFSVVLLLAAMSAPLSAAGIDVPELELYSWGRAQDGTFGLLSRGEMDLRVEGGFKLGARVLFSFFSDTLEEASAYAIPLLTFKAAGFQLKDLFSLPVDLTYFVGEEDTFCSGQVFEDFFGVGPFASRYPGFIHFPENDPPFERIHMYEGIHTINGTGMALDIELKKAQALLSLFVYQDGNTENLDFRPGRGAADLRTALNFPKLKLEAFVGATYPVPDAMYGYYRGGLLFYTADQGVEFLAQLGIPRWAPGLDSLGIELLYLLVEPRVRMGIFSVIPTFFWRPAYFLLKKTREQAFDINLNLIFGDPVKWPIAGGLESSFVYQTEEYGETVNEFRVQASPYLQFLTRGVLWEARLKTNVWPFATSNLLEVVVAIQAEL